MESTTEVINLIGRREDTKSQNGLETRAGMDQRGRSHAIHSSAKERERRPMPVGVKRLGIRTGQKGYFGFRRSERTRLVALAVPSGMNNL